MSTLDFVPPTFKNLGKRLKDLFSKKYDYKKELLLKSTARNNIEIESGAEAQDAGGYGGHLKLKHANRDYGVFEANLNTNGRTEYSVETSNLYRGLTVKLSGDEAPAGVVDLTYQQNFLALSTVVAASAKGKSLREGLVIGFDGLSVGGEVAYDISGGALVDYNAGAEYSQADLTLTVKTANNADQVTTSIIHDISKDLAAGGQFDYSIGSGARTFTLGGSYLIDADTIVKAKVNSKSVFSSVWEHRLRNPALKLALATEHNLGGNLTLPTRVGLALTAGDV